MRLSTELKVGLLILAAGLLVITASIAITGWNPELEDTYTISTVFHNISGLQVGSPVRIAGIKIGTIDRIELDGNNARVMLKIFSKYPVYSDSQATIKSIGILGDKYVELVRGSPTQLALQEGDEIKRIVTGGDMDAIVENFGAALRDIQNVTKAMNHSFGGEEGERRFDAILNNLEELTSNVNDISRVTNSRIDNITLQLDHFTRDLAQITSENKESIADILANIRTFSEDLHQITAENRQNVRVLISDLQRFSNSLATDGPQITQDLRGILSENRENLRRSLTNLDLSFAKLDRTMQNMESISKKVDQGQGTVGKLINDDQTVEGLNRALDNVNKLLGGVEKIKLDLGVHAEYLSKNQGAFGEKSHAKGYATVQLQPLRDRYYLLQLVSNPRGKRTQTKEITNKTVDGSSPQESEEIETKISEELQFSAQIVQRYYDTQFKLGLFENKFGLGVEQLFGKRDEFKIGVDAWDFGAEAGTHLKANATWRFHSNLFVTAGADDFGNTDRRLRDNFIGFGITFNEDILKPYLGSLPLGAVSK